VPINTYHDFEIDVRINEGGRFTMVIGIAVESGPGYVFIDPEVGPMNVAYPGFPFVGLVSVVNAKGRIYSYKGRMSYQMPGTYKLKLLAGYLRESPKKYVPREIYACTEWTDEKEVEVSAYFKPKAPPTILKRKPSKVILPSATLKHRTLKKGLVLREKPLRYRALTPKTPEVLLKESKTDELEDIAQKILLFTILGGLGIIVLAIILKRW
jgi:hypothetical protein